MLGTAALPRPLAARAECCMLGAAALYLTCPARLQALRRMLLFGFPSDARTLQQVPVVPGVVQGLLEALQALLSLRPALRQPAARSQAAIMLERGLIKMAKTLVSTQETHPWSGPPALAPAWHVSWTMHTGGALSGWLCPLHPGCMA